MKRLKIIAMTAALMLALSLSACSGAAQPEATSDTTTEASTTTTTTEATTTTTEATTTTTTTEQTTTTTTTEATTTTTTTEATTTTKKPKETEDPKAKYKGMTDIEIAESFIGKKAKSLIKVLGGKLKVVQACVDDVGLAIIEYKDFTVQCEQKTPDSDWIVTEVF